MPQTTAITRRKVKKFAVSLAAVQRRIYMIRGVKVMLDEDLAGMYGVPTKRLNEASGATPAVFQRTSCSS